MGKRGPKAKDLTGQKFGKLTVLESIPAVAGEHAQQLRCRCDCGNEIVALKANVTRGNTQSCGCLLREALERKRAPSTKGKCLPVTAFVGQTFGRATVLADAGRNAHGHQMVRCQCACGNLFETRLSSLKSGNTKSCGCAMRDHLKDLLTKHGDSAQRSQWKKLYHVWSTIKERCTNVNWTYYKDYGGRGISYCAEWEDWGSFRDWAIQHGYKEGLTIDRIDVDGNYCPENCRWVTLDEQANNRRSNRFASFMGRRMTYAQWSRELGIPYSVFYSAMSSGLTVDRLVDSRRRHVGLGEEGDFVD